MIRKNYTITILEEASKYTQGDGNMEIENAYSSKTPDQAGTCDPVCVVSKYRIPLPTEEEPDNYGPKPGF
ncbi:MAG: hypothetical protein JW855_06020 [Gammaproteobacteria bacterium]|nr:hypothetical protein [Gammaproteobacteria bacterium]